MRGTISILGLYQWDNTIFDDVQLPEGIDRTVLVSNIIGEGAELEVLYPEPGTMKTMIRNWSIARLHEWERMYLGDMMYFNPIHNYDRTEDNSDAGSNTSEVVRNHAEGNNHALRPGFNTGAGSVEAETTKFDTNSDGLSRGAFTETHNIHAYGNIGVTTSSAMLTEERQLREWDLYQQITKEFLARFTLMVY